MTTDSQQMRKLMEAASGKILHEGRYWDGEGRYEQEANELEKLMPGSGQAETQRGELFRAAAKIYHDFYNNGFGNSWEAPLTFLANYANLSRDVYDWLAQYAGGNVHGGRGDEPMIEKMMDEVVQAALKVPADMPAKHDMWDTPFDSYDFPTDDYDDGDDYDYSYDDEDDDDEGSYGSQRGAIYDD